jgi:hypothetical protein
MTKPKRRKPTRMKDLAAKKPHNVRGGKGTADSLQDAKDKASGGLLGTSIGTMAR